MSFSDLKMRKFAIILLNDIMKDRQSRVRSEFAALMEPGDEEKIRELFSEKEIQPDDDITVSIDQTESLYEAIAFNGLEFPEVDDDGWFDGRTLLPFLERLCGIFNWERYESETLGHVGKYSQKHGRLSWYAVILSQWVSGAGLNQIMFQAIAHKKQNPVDALFIENQFVDYNDSKEHSSAGIRCDLAGPFRRLFRMNFRPCLNNAAKGISQDRDYRLLYKVSVPAFPVTDPRYDHSYDCFTVEFRHEAAVFVREFLPVFFLHTSKNGICDPHKVLKEKSVQFVSSS